MIQNKKVLSTKFKNNHKFYIFLASKFNNIRLETDFTGLETISFNLNDFYFTISIKKNRCFIYEINSLNEYVSNLSYQKAILTLKDLLK